VVAEVVGLVLLVLAEMVFLQVALLQEVMAEAEAVI
jgi:hypothetical protein